MSSPEKRTANLLAVLEPLDDALRVLDVIPIILSYSSLVYWDVFDVPDDAHPCVRVLKKQMLAKNKEHMAEQWDNLKTSDPDFNKLCTFVSTVRARLGVYKDKEYESLPVNSVTRKTYKITHLREDRNGNEKFAFPMNLLRTKAMLKNWVLKFGDNNADLLGAIDATTSGNSNYWLKRCFFCMDCM